MSEREQMWAAGALLASGVGSLVFGSTASAWAVLVAAGLLVGVFFDRATKSRS